jgi:hypothetical protein
MHQHPPHLDVGDTFLPAGEGLGQQPGLAGLDRSKSRLAVAVLGVGGPDLRGHGQRVTLIVACRQMLHCP